MSVELEAKMKVDSHDPYRERLREAGATPTGERMEVNSFFDSEDRSLLAADKGLRLRVSTHAEGGKSNAILTYKGPRQPGAFKSREEIETGVEEAAQLMAIFTALGFKQVLSFEKKRESWKLDDCKVELDEVPHLGTFLEVEGPSEKSIRAVQKKLGLENTPVVRESYAGMLTTWLQERGNREKKVTFDKKPDKR